MIGCYDNITFEHILSDVYVENIDLEDTIRYYNYNNKHNCQVITPTYGIREYRVLHLEETGNRYATILNFVNLS